MNICDFIQPEIDYIRKNANFTAQEEMLFDLRNKEMSLELCAEAMNVSLSTASRINKKMKKKIIKLL